MSSGRQPVEELTEADRHRRPASVRPLAFADLARPGPRLRVDGLSLIPIESVRPGDEQVFAARLPRRPGEPVVDLTPLAGCPSVRSVVASTIVVASRPLPQIAELLLLDRTLVPDARTLASLPGLERLWAGWAPSDRRLAVGALPAGRLRELGAHRAALPGGPAELAPLTGLRRLFLDGCWPKDSLEPLAGMVHLVSLRANAPGGWSKLRGLTALEEVVAIEPRLANLRAFSAWTRLRDLMITGTGVQRLAGLEAFGGLERLRLVALRIDDLEALTGLSHLAAIELTGLTHLHDLGPLGSLPSLRQLVVARLGRAERDTIHLDSLRPLVGARALEELVLRGVVVEDGDLAPLADLPVLRRVEVYGDIGTAVAALRKARPDVEVVWREGSKPTPGVQAGPVFLHPADERIPVWWLREDLTGLLRTSTNAGAEERLRTALAVENPQLLERLRFDTEADAVTVEAKSEADLRAVARVIERLAGPSGTPRA